MERTPLQRWGGVAALTQATLYIVGIVVFVGVLDYLSATTPEARVQLLVEHHRLIHTLNLLLYVVGGLLIVVLSLALHQRLRDAASSTMQVATIVAIIWAGLLIGSGMVSNLGTATVVELHRTDPEAAVVLWRSIDPVVQGLGGQMEIMGGLWTLLVSWVAWKGQLLHRVLNGLGIVVGAGGLVSAVPALNTVGVAIFGLGQILWFLGLGVLMLRAPPGSPSEDAPPTT